MHLGFYFPSGMVGATYHTMISTAPVHQMCIYKFQLLRKLR